MNIGFAGLGIMGLPMAVNIVKKSGFPVTGFDVFPEAVEKLKAEGGRGAADLAALAAGSDVVFLCLPTNELMQAAVETIMQSGRPGTVIVDLGSTAPGIIRDLEPRVRAAGMHLLDSPVSGGDIGAKAGTLAIMCGGEEDVFARVKSLLACMGTSVTYMGGSGNGSVAKLANNMIVGIYLATFGEAFAFAVKAGLDPRTLYNAIKDGYAGAKILDVKLPKLLERDFTPGARTAVHQKDLKNAVAFAKHLGVDIPLTKDALAVMNELEAMGLINEDQIAMAKVHEKAMNVVIQ